MKGYVDFMIILSPSDHVKSMVKSYKSRATNLIGDYEGMHSVAHISIKDLPRQKPYIAEPTMLLLEKKLKAIPPIDLIIDGFDHFNHGQDFKSIYARIRSTPSTVKWFKELKKYLNIKEYLVPHITIARNIPSDAFNKLWPDFKNEKWMESFRVNCLTILHREAFATFKKFEIYKELNFESTVLYEETKPRTHAVDLRKAASPISRQTSLF